MTALDTTGAATASTTSSVDLIALAEATAETRTPTPLPPAVRAAWTRLPGVHGTVRPPEAARPWTDADVLAAYAVLDTARALHAYADAMAKDVTEAVLTHVDHLAAARAAADPAYAARLAAASRNKKGHAVLGRADHPVQIAVPGTARVLSVEYTTGAPQISVEALEAARKAGEISRGELRRFTRKVTVVDPEALGREVDRNPGLAHRLRGAWSAGRTSIAVHLRTLKTT